MNTPNPELMHLYGTDAYYLEKCGAFADVLRIAAPAAWLGLLAHKNREEERHREEAAILNMAMRAAEAERMRPMLEGFYGHDVPGHSAQEDYSDPAEAIRSLANLKVAHASLVRSTAYSPASIAQRYQALVQAKAAEEEDAAAQALARASEAERMRPMLESLGKYAEDIGRSMARRELEKQAFLGFGAPKVPTPKAPAPPPIYGAGGRMALPNFNTTPAPPTTTPKPAPGGLYRTPAAAPASAPVPKPPPVFDPEKSINNPNQYLDTRAAHTTGLATPEYGAKPSPWQKPGQKIIDRRNAAAAAAVPKPVVKPTVAPKPGGGFLRKITPGKILGAGAIAVGAGLAYKGINKLKQNAEHQHAGGQSQDPNAPAMYTGVGEYGHPVYRN